MPNPPLRLLLVHTVLWSHYKAAVFSMAHRLAEREQVEFKVIQIARNEHKRRDLGEVDYEAHQYPYELLFDDFLETVPLLNRVLRVLRAIRQFQPDVLIIPGYADPVCWAALAYCRWHGLRIASTMGSTEHDRPRFVLKEKLKTWLLARIDGVFCYGTPQRRYLNKLGMPDHKIILRQQATDNQRVRELFLRAKAAVRPGEAFPTRNFVYAGRLAPEKNLFALLDAFGQCTSDWGLILVGGGPDEKALKAHCRERQLERVFFVGARNWQDVFTYYAQGTVFVLPSTREPWGVVINEAMLCEMPVLVSSRCGCAPDLVRQGMNGFAFDPHKTEELAAYMQYMIDEESALEAMGQASYRIIEHYTPEKAAKQLLDGAWQISGRPTPRIPVPENC